MTWLDPTGPLKPRQLICHLQRGDGTASSRDCASGLITGCDLAGFQRVPAFSGLSSGAFGLLSYKSQSGVDGS
jgi:hypothetical protein